MCTLTNMFAYLYSRVSNKNSQVDESAHQVTSMVNYCTEKGYSVVKTYFDKGTGANTREHSGMKEMWQDIASDSRPNKIILVFEVSRFSRTWENTLPLFEKCRQHSINIHSVSQNLTWNYSVASSNAGFESALTIAQQEYYHTCERNRASVQARKEKGIKIGSAPYGYMRDPQDKTKFIPHPEEMAQIKRLQDLYVGGLDCYDSAQVLRDEDVGIRGLHWTDNSVKMVLKRTGAFKRPFGNNPAVYPHPETICYEEAMRPEGPRITPVQVPIVAKSEPVFEQRPIIQEGEAGPSNAVVVGRRAGETQIFSPLTIKQEREYPMPESSNVGIVEYGEELTFLPDWIIRNKLNHLANEKRYKFVWFNRREKNMVHYIKEIKNDEDKKLVGEIFSDDMLIIGKRDL